MSLNKSILSGRLTKDPEIKRSASNVAIVSFSIAISEYNTKTKQQDVQYIDCVLLGKRGETFEKYVHKGDYVVVNGKIEKRIFKGDDNKNHAIYRILVDDFDFVPKSGGKVVEENPANAILEPENAAPTQEAPLEDLTDDDLPF